MRLISRLLCLGSALLLVSGTGCTSAAHAVAAPTPEHNAPVYVAQSATCWNSMSCCIQNHPLTPVESCGASAQDIAEALNGMKALEDDFANNAHLPEWKQECIRNYVACQNEPDWKGPCYDCLRRCEGQQQWPFKMCGPSVEQGK